MCGICGEIRFDDQAPDRGAVERMSARLAPRGPDDDGYHQDGPVALGHRRLALLDPSDRAPQPTTGPAPGRAVVFNGTIYNYPELRQALMDQGHAFRSSGDTEVILKAYAAWGDDFVAHLHGMFAFALWDRRRGRLLLVRDRLGIKPLYYTLDGRRLRFASNPQALLAAGGVDTAIDSVGLHPQLTLHAVVPAPRTVLRGVRKLEPAHQMEVTPRGLGEPRPYWRLTATRAPEPRTEAEWTEAVHTALREAVERRLRIADVPVGVLLSGGLDSSLLVGLLHEAGVEDIRTFSIGFEDAPEEAGSEFEYSDQVVERFDTRHHKYRIPNDHVLERLPEAVGHMAEPMVAQDAVAFFLLAEQVSQQVKVVQSGQGADEVFAGYFWYPRMHQGSGPPAERFGQHYFDRDHEEFLETVAAVHWGEDHTSALVERRLSEPGADRFIDQVLRFDTTTLIVDDPVKRVDNMTMAWGLEARVPFLDHELVELAASMPAEHKLREEGKGVLKDAARRVIPSAVIDRPKGYFPVPVLKYLRGEYLDFVRDLTLGPRARERGLFQPAYVEALVADPEAHITPLRGSKLWQVALLELWLQQHGC